MKDKNDFLTKKCYKMKDYLRKKKELKNIYLLKKNLKLKVIKENHNKKITMKIILVNENNDQITSN